MRVDLANMARNAAACISNSKDAAGYRFALCELANHIDQVRSGEATLEEFASFYMIELDRAKPLPQSRPDAH